MKRFRMVVTDAGSRTRVAVEVGNSDEFVDFLTKLRLVMRETAHSHPAVCSGFAVTMHPLETCEHEP